jgi:hypothetical protein
MKRLTDGRQVMAIPCVRCANKKGCTRLATESDKSYQLVAHGWWFSLASSTTKTGRHDIAEILLKVALKHQKSKPIYGHLTLRHFRLYKVHSYLLTVLNTGFLQSAQVQRIQNELAQH